MTTVIGFVLKQISVDLESFRIWKEVNPSSNTIIEETPIENNTKSLT